jgi:hypothetical protein
MLSHVGVDLWPRELRLLQQGSAVRQELARADHPRPAVVQALQHLPVSSFQGVKHGDSRGHELLCRAYQRVVVCGHVNAVLLKHESPASRLCPRWWLFDWEHLR